MIRKLFLVLAGGFCGAVTRYLLAKPLLALAGALPGTHAGFPYDTLLINLTGAFLIGLLFGAFEHGAPISPDLRLALGTGFLGAYTTFSSFVVGAAGELRHGQTFTALLYLCGAMAGGVLLAFVGFTLAGGLVERWRAGSLDAQEAAVAGGDWVNDGAIGDVSAEELERNGERIAELEGGAR
ncbi:MAG TPA: CrcB family protein [Ktedonobacterales bacterium]|nr:CrcB family protein [Ktedonobacterales bacterium]